jgi:hypothetical protein
MKTDGTSLVSADRGIHLGMFVRKKRHMSCNFLTLHLGRRVSKQNLNTCIAPRYKNKLSMNSYIPTL